jgi:hypothetical protein
MFVPVNLRAIYMLNEEPNLSIYAQTMIKDAFKLKTKMPPFYNFTWVDAHGFALSNPSVPHTYSSNSKYQLKPKNFLTKR